VAGKRKTFSELTKQDKICNDTECDFNDFGKCLTEPQIDRHGFVNCYKQRLTTLVCHTRRTRDMCDAMEELGLE